MKTRISMNEVIFSSAYEPTEIVKLMKHAPESTAHKDADGDVDFVYKFDPNAGAITNFGIVFNDCDNNGKAALKVSLNLVGTLDEKKQHIAEKYGKAITLAGAVEDQMDGCIEAIDARIGAIAHNIDVIA